MKIEKLRVVILGHEENPRPKLRIHPVSVVMFGGRTSFALHRAAATLSIGNSDDMLVGAVIAVVVINMGVFGWCAPTYKFAVL